MAARVGWNPVTRASPLVLNMKLSFAPVFMEAVLPFLLLVSLCQSILNKGNDLLAIFVTK